MSYSYTRDHAKETTYTTRSGKAVTLATFIDGQAAEHCHEGEPFESLEDIAQWAKEVVPAIAAANQFANEQADIYGLKVKGAGDKEYLISWGNRSYEWQRVTYVTLSERRAYETGEQTDLTSELAQVTTAAIRSSK
jgi:hypothetical protein|uniref:Uncharacterized protein n=1 Tax=Siphoviridae sp. ct33S22 TaxID=2826279 RepID=A0A8S5QJZ2_9CAUD|nr:MAG TPA: hypothetical protein [Siphoviridae sp. ct33S22]